MLTIEWRKGLQRCLFDIHRVVGAVLGLLIAVSVATGAYMAWRPLGEFVSVLAGQKLPKPPKVVTVVADKSATLSLDEMAAQAQAQFPDAAIGFIQLPAEANRALRVRLKLRDDPHPNGLTSVWLHPQTGAVLAINRWNELDAGARAVSIVYPLHTGELGGIALEAATFASGLGLAVLGLSGIWLWLRRRKTSSRAVSTISARKPIPSR